MTIISKIICFSCLFFMYNCDSSNELKPETIVKQEVDLKTNIYTKGIVISADQGQTWKAMDGNLPDAEVRSITMNEGQLYVGYSKNEIYTTQIAKTNEWKVEDIEESLIHSDKVNNGLSALYTIGNEVYATTIFGDIFYKKSTIDRWQPMKKPADHQYIADMKKDSEGNLFVATDYGLYSTNNKGKSWDQVYNLGTLYGFEFVGDNIVVTGNKGIFSSKDKGKTWIKATTVENNTINMRAEEPRYRLLQVGGEVIASRLNNQVIAPGNKFQSIKNNGMSWQTHPMDASLAGLQGVDNIEVIGNTLFCTHKDGLARSTDGGKTWVTVLKHTSDAKNMTALGMYVHEGLLYCYEIMAGC